MDGEPELSARRALAAEAVPILLTALPLAGAVLWQLLPAVQPHSTLASRRSTAGTQAVCTAGRREPCGAQQRVRSRHRAVVPVASVSQRRRASEARRAMVALAGVLAASVVAEQSVVKRDLEE